GRHHPVMLSKSLQAALEAWYRRYVLQAPLEWSLPRICLTTDASSTGWEAHLDDVEISRQWSPTEAHLHINIKELIAVVQAIKHWKFRLSRVSILLQADNVSVIKWIRSHVAIVNSQAQVLIEQLYEHLYSLRSHIA